MESTGLLLPMLAMIVIWYFLLIRPQQKRAKLHREKINAMQKKDEVITQGGIYGTVVSTDETTATIEIAKGVNIKVVKSTVQSVSSK